MSLGILGGMSWSSTIEYYRLLNLGIHDARGKQYSADLVIASVDFQKIIDLQVKNHWNEAGKILGEKAQGLKQAGATTLLIASNTMHRVLNVVTDSCDLPVLNIFDAVAGSLKKNSIRKAGLLGTRYTMTDPFFVTEYKNRGVSIVAPERGDAKQINEIIFRELIHGTVTEQSRKQLLEISERLIAQGAEAVILGCTELSLLIDNSPGTMQLPFLDTTKLHVEMALKWLLDQPNCR